MGEPQNAEQIHELEDRCERALAEFKKHKEPELVKGCRETLAALYRIDPDVPTQRTDE